LKPEEGDHATALKLGGPLTRAHAGLPATESARTPGRTAALPPNHRERLVVGSTLPAKLLTWRSSPQECNAPAQLRALALRELCVVHADCRQPKPARQSQAEPGAIKELSS